jgi:membrane-bound lytic murein transglycosylase MltF
MPFSASWSIRAMIVYDKWIWNRVRAASDCDRWAFTLSAYNGGLGWVQRDQRLTASKGMDPLRWDDVAQVNAGRSAANFKENRGYPVRILDRWGPIYQAAGWGRGGCDDR